MFGLLLFTCLLHYALSGDMEFPPCDQVNQALCGTPRMRDYCPQVCGGGAASGRGPTKATGDSNKSKGEEDGGGDNSPQQPSPVDDKPATTTTRKTIGAAQTKSFERSSEEDGRTTTKGEGDQPTTKKSTADDTGSKGSSNGDSDMINISNSGTAKGGTSNSDTSNTGSSHTGASNTGSSKGGASKTGSSNSGASHSESSNSDTSNSDTSNSGTSNSGASNSGTSKTGSSKSGASKGAASNNGGSRNRGSSSESSSDSKAKCNKVEPCVDAATANAAFLDRCKSRGVAESCLDKCRYDVTFDELKKAMLSKNCPVAGMRNYLKCGANDKDNRQCCEKTGVLEGNRAFCHPFCYPDGPEWPPQKQAMKYLPCASQMAQIMKCHWAGIEP